MRVHGVRIKNSEKNVGKPKVRGKEDRETTMVWKNGDWKGGGENPLYAFTLQCVFV